MEIRERPKRIGSVHNASGARMVAASSSFSIITTTKCGKREKQSRSVMMHRPINSEKGGEQIARMLALCQNEEARAEGPKSSEDDDENNISMEANLKLRLQ